MGTEAIKDTTAQQGVTNQPPGYLAIGMSRDTAQQQGLLNIFNYANKNKNKSIEEEEYQMYYYPTLPVPEFDKSDAIFFVGQKRLMCPKYLVEEYKRLDTDKNNILSLQEVKKGIEERIELYENYSKSLTKRSTEPLSIMEKILPGVTGGAIGGMVGYLAVSLLSISAPLALAGILGAGAIAGAHFFIKHEEDIAKEQIKYWLDEKIKPYLKVLKEEYTKQPPQTTKK